MAKKAKVEITKDGQAFIFGDKSEGIKIEHKDGKILIEGWYDAGIVGLGVWSSAQGTNKGPMQGKLSPWEVEVGDFLETLGIYKAAKPNIDTIVSAHPNAAKSGPVAQWPRGIEHEMREVKNGD